MHRAVAHIGVGLTLLAGPAVLDAPSDGATGPRARTLERLRAGLAVEQLEAQDLGRRLAAASMWRHARAARAE